MGISVQPRCFAVLLPHLVTRESTACCIISTHFCARSTESTQQIGAPGACISLNTVQVQPPQYLSPFDFMQGWFRICSHSHSWVDASFLTETSMLTALVPHVQAHAGCYSIRGP